MSVSRAKGLTNFNKYVHYDNSENEYKYKWKEQQKNLLKICDFRSINYISMGFVMRKVRIYDFGS